MFLLKSVSYDMSEKYANKLSYLFAIASFTNSGFFKNFVKRSEAFTIHKSSLRELFDDCTQLRLSSKKFR